MVAACLTALGCGGDDEGQPIPATQAEQLESRLDEVERRLGDGSTGACTDIVRDTEPAVDEILASLPQDVEARDALGESFDRLFALTSEQCAEQQAQPPTDTGETDTDESTTPTVTETETSPTDVPTDTGSTETDTGTDTTDTGEVPPPDQETDETPSPGKVTAAARARPGAAVERPERGRPPLPARAPPRGRGMSTVFRPPTRCWSARSQ